MNWIGNFSSLVSCVCLKFVWHQTEGTYYIQKIAAQN